MLESRLLEDCKELKEMKNTLEIMKNNIKELEPTYQVFVQAQML